MSPTTPSTEIIADLLPIFRKCSNYEDRLKFWEKYNLYQHLFYLTNDDDKDKEFNFNSWEELIQFPILTLAPFSQEETEQFTVWALRHRLDMNTAISTFEEKKKFVLEKYSEIKSISDKKDFLAEYTKQIENNKKADFKHYLGDKNAELILDLL